MVHQVHQPLPALEHFRAQSDLDTLEFANKQVARLEACLSVQSPKDERVPLLVQLPGVGIIGAMTILGAVGDVIEVISLI